MIRILQKNGRNIPMLICDVCNTWIEDAGEAAAVWRTAETDGAVSDVLHVHKRGCHNEAELRIGGRQWCSWEELGMHIFHLATNTGLPPEELQQLQDLDDLLGL